MTRYGIRPRFLVRLVLVFVAVGAVIAIIDAVTPGSNQQPYPPVPASAARELQTLRAPADFRRTTGEAACAKSSSYASTSVCFSSPQTFRTRLRATALLSRFGLTNEPDLFHCVILRSSLLDPCNGEATWRDLLLSFTLISDRSHHKGFVYGSQLDLTVLTARG